MRKPNQNQLVAHESIASKFERMSYETALGILAIVGITLLIAPTIIVLITSFTNAFSLKFPPPGWSTKWYVALWKESPEILDALVLSIKLASLAVAFAILLAVPAAIAIARRRETWARLIESLFLSPLMLPSLALGLALLMLFNLAGTGLSFTTLVIGHIAITAPYIFRLNRECKKFRSTAMVFISNHHFATDFARDTCGRFYRLYVLIRQCSGFTFSFRRTKRSTTDPNVAHHRSES
jgi:ABC-type Fe3+ transport system permease subunit